MNKVYIVNKAGHDFSKARRYGKLTFLTDGVINKYSINNMYRTFAEHISNSNPTDWILMTGLTSMNVVLTSQFTYKHGRLNLLIHDGKIDKYVERKIVMDSLIKKGENG